LTGGLELGLEWAGLGPVMWQVENNEYCNKVLAKHWPDVKRYKDVKEVHSSSYLDSHVRTFYPPEGEDYTQEEKEMASKLKKLTLEQVEQCVSMYKAGMSLQPIADYFGITRQGMWDLLRRRTDMRPQKRFGKDNHFYRGGPVSDDPAQNVVEKAIEKGILTRASQCSECKCAEKPFKDGRSNIQAHHDDYNKPLEVKWLCQKCHHKWHKTNEPVRKEVLRELSKCDLICGGFP
jgi:hypothetical protein